ncbi:MAG: class I SAM-dependent rRNA methyltransferase [Flavobacteriales bacterium]|nr:class I SAM-dependent rRNA methyltransferase [Flavobacteriales bacterium]
MSKSPYRTIELKRGKQSINRKHPWIFSGALHKIPRDLEEGEKVSVVNEAGETVVTGHFGKGSIAVRVLEFGPAVIDEQFYTKKIENALSVRVAIGLAKSENTNAYRLMHGEGDGVPGLVIDIYKNVAVVQSHSAGVSADTDLIKNALKNVLVDAIAEIILKNTDQRESIKTSATVEITEHAHRFEVDYISGQKTGFFIDQRENRRLLGSYADGKKVLNAFSYTGGFSVYAFSGGASEVHSLDSSRSALATLEQNLKINDFEKSNHKSIAADALEYLNSDEARDASYDIVVLDPPAFAKHRSARHRAIQAYKRLNARAMKILKPGSIVFTFSCSQVVTPELFNHTIAAAAIESGRDIRILHHLHQPADHPISIFHPEGEYLKGLVLRIE